MFSKSYSFFISFLSNKSGVCPKQQTDSIKKHPFAICPALTVGLSAKWVNISPIGKRNIALLRFLFSIGFQERQETRAKGCYLKGTTKAQKETAAWVKQRYHIYRHRERVKTLNNQANIETFSFCMTKVAIEQKSY